MTTHHVTERTKTTAASSLHGRRELSAPLHVRFVGLETSEAFVERARERLERRLARFGRHIGRVTVRVEDENGPKGGVDKVSRIKLVMRGVPNILVEARATDAYAAFDAALKIAASTVSTTLALARDVRRRASTGP